MREIRGKRSHTSLRLALVVSENNEFISQRLVEGALHACLVYGIPEENLVVTWVPGTFELALVAKKLATTKQADAILCLGAEIGNETDPGIAAGIQQASMETGLPILFGILAAETNEQALALTGKKNKNKGFEMVEAALEMVSIYQQIENAPTKRKQSPMLSPSLSIQTSSVGKV